MAEAVVRLTAKDVKGAVLSSQVVEDNDPEALIRWLKCRGFTASKSESKKKLVERVKDLQESGLAKHVIDPDCGANKARILDSLALNKSREIPLPLVANWTTNLTGLPHNFSYGAVVEYLVKRKVYYVNRTESSEEEMMEVEMPTADKPLRKGFNFFKSGHVDTVKINKLDNVTHVTASVLSSYKEKKYRTDMTLDNSSGHLLQAKCACVAGKGGKCNHVAGLLFGLLDFVESTNQAPASCTSEEQRWHQPSRKAKRQTKPVKIGVRSLHKHVYGRQLKRKRALEDYENYDSRSKTPRRNRLHHVKESLGKLKSAKHDTGLLQLLNSSTDTGSEGEAPAEDGTTRLQQLPEEIVTEKLQVTKAKRDAIQTVTIGQANNIQWFKHKKGRLTASKAKRYIGKGNAAIMTKEIITIKKPSFSKIPAMQYGIINEQVAAKIYVEQKASKGTPVVTHECGLYVDMEHGQLAASPDRLVDDISEGEEQRHGLLEVKCLYSCKDMSISDAIPSQQKKSHFPVKIVDNTTFILKETHSYYYQMQMQMGVTGRKWCDFVMFTNSESDVFILRVRFDEDFWHKLRDKLLDFHNRNVVPALVAQGFYKST